MKNPSIAVSQSSLLNQVTGRQNPGASHDFLYFTFSVTNKVNGKKWISTTRQTPDERFYEEKQKTKNANYGKISNYKKTPLREAIIADGEQNFIINIEHTTTDKKAAYSADALLVKKLKTKDPAFGYNR